MQVDQYFAALQFPPAEVMGNETAQQAAGRAQHLRVVETAVVDASEDRTGEDPLAARTLHWHRALLGPVLVKRARLEPLPGARHFIHHGGVPEQSQQLELEIAQQGRRIAGGA
jgi:hypothetical protein